MTPAERAHVVVVESIDSVFAAHYGRLVRALTVVSGNREMAADAVQEAFVAAATCTGGGSVATRIRLAGSVVWRSTSCATRVAASAAGGR